MYSTEVTSPVCNECNTKMQFDNGDCSADCEACHYCPNCGNIEAIQDNDVSVLITEEDFRLDNGKRIRSEVKK